MRLDHLLSREPVFGDAHQGHVVCLVCVSCARISSLGFFWWVWVRGCFLVENRGASSMEANTLSGSRSTPFERLARMLLAPGWHSLFVGVGVGGVCGGLFVICIVVVSIFCFLVVWFCLVLLGIRWMPWHQELMKDVAACDMPRGVGERALIRGCPNGGT